MSTHGHTMTNRRAVTFSEFSEMRIIPRENETGSKWISSQEKQRNRREMIGSIMRMSRDIIRNTAPGAATPEQLFECIGIEKFLTPDFARNLREKRRAHVDAVISEQRRQVQEGVSDIEALKEVSKASSRSNRYRSCKLAMGFWLLKE